MYMLKPKRILQVIVAVTLCLYAMSLAPQQTSAQNSDPNSRFGIVNGYEAPEIVEQLGVSWELVTIRWDELQPSSGGQWQTDDDFEAWLLESQQANREVVGTLLGTPGWATAGNARTGVPSGLYLPIDSPDNEWAVFVARAVDYYAEFGIDKWVVWENADVGSGVAGSTWDGSVEDYFQLVKVAYLVANNTNSNAEMHLGGIRYRDPTWFGDLMDEVINDPDARENNYYFDIASVHLFGSTDDAFTQTGNMYFVMSQRSIPLKPVWVNRMNARPAEDQAYGGGQSFNEFSNVTLEQQASYIIQAHALAFAAGADRVSFYRTVDDLSADGNQAYGLVREDGSERPALDAYQTVTEHISGFVFARRVDEEAFPLMDYVRFTFADRVVHVVWARTELDATITIPSRSTDATLVDSQGNQQSFDAESGLYRLSVEGATCDDPVYNCLIGGPPLILIENDVIDPINAVPPPVEVEEGGVPLIVIPDLPATPTATITPTSDPSEQEPTLEAEAAPAEEPTEEPAQEPEPQVSQPDENATLTVAEAAVESAGADAAAPAAPQIDEASIRNVVQPTGIRFALPFILIALGAVAVGFGSWYFFRPLIGTSSGEELIEAPDEDEPEDIIALGSGVPEEEYTDNELEDVEYEEEYLDYEAENAELDEEDFDFFERFDEDDDWSEEDYRLD